MLVLMAGLPGTGKSTLSRAVAERTGFNVLDKDTIRAALFPAGLIEYSREQDDFVVRIMLKVAGWILKRDPQATVILDGRPFAKRYQVEMAINFADWIQTPWRIVECTCSEETARHRVASAKDHLAADRDSELHQRVRSDWKEITHPKLLVDTEQPLEHCVRSVLTYLGGRYDLNHPPAAEL